MTPLKTLGVLLVSVTLSGAQERVSSTAPNSNVSDTPGQSQLLSDLINAQVMLQGDQNVGQIQDFVIGPDGNLQFAIAGGADNQSFAVPFSALSTNSTTQSVTVNIDRDQFDRLNFFDRNNLPDFNSRDFRQGMTDVFGRNALSRLDRIGDNAAERADRRQDRVQDARENIDDRVDRVQDRRRDARDNAADQVDRLQDRAQDARDRLENRAQSTREKVQDARGNIRDNRNDQNVPQGRGNLGANDTQGQDTLNPAGKPPPGLNRDNRQTTPQPRTPQNPNASGARPGTKTAQPRTTPVPSAPRPNTSGGGQSGQGAGTNPVPGAGAGPAGGTPAPVGGTAAPTIK